MFQEPLTLARGELGVSSLYRRENIKMAKNKGGRPKADIDEQKVFKLAKLQCTHKEIAEFFNVSTDTIARRFADVILKGQEVGKTSLRRAQFKAAIKGSTAMLIWLGKQYLSQTEKVNITNDELMEEKISIVPNKNGNGRFQRFYN